MRKRLLSLLIVLAIISLLVAIRTVYYQINPNQCWNCGRCTWHCPTDAIQFSPDLGHFYIIPELCNGCGVCEQYCPYGAIYLVTGNTDDTDHTLGLNLKCYPNPASDFTDMTITLPSKSKQAELAVFDLKGRLVFQKKIGKTSTTLRWQGLNERGQKLPSGVYLAHLTCDKTQITKKLTLERQ
jgi:NAD-dependent dihydropyrimidine dehydrogenase PreA subunit